MSTVKKVSVKKAVTTSKKTAGKKPNSEAVKKAAEVTTQKQLSEFEQKMAIIKAKQEEEARIKAEKKAEEMAKKKRPGVILSILNFISDAKAPVTQRQVLEYLKQEFPNREEKSMLNTIKAQIGGKKRPLRMEREKRVIFGIVENKVGVKTYIVEYSEEGAGS